MNHLPKLARILLKQDGSSPAVGASAVAIMTEKRKEELWECWGPAFLPHPDPGVVVAVGELEQTYLVVTPDKEGFRTLCQNLDKFRNGFVDLVIHIPPGKWRKVEETLRTCGHSVVIDLTRRTQVA